MDLSQLPSAFYRVSVKVLAFDDAQRLLVCKSARGWWEMPGGGWEHGESLEECVKRELAEEARAQVAEVGPIVFAYPCFVERKNFYKLCMAVRVKLAEPEVFAGDDDIVEVKYVSRQEFLALEFDPEEAPVMNYTDLIWPTS